MPSHFPHERMRQTSIRLFNWNEKPFFFFLYNGLGSPAGYVPMKMTKPFNKKKKKKKRQRRRERPWKKKKHNRIALQKTSSIYSQEFAFGGASFDDIRDGDGRVPVGEVRIIAASWNGDAKTKARHSVHRHVVVLPCYSLPGSSLKRSRKVREQIIDDFIFKFIFSQTLLDMI